MEAASVNMVEPGDKAIVCVAGVFGERMADSLFRAGAQVIRVDTSWGKPVDPDDVGKALVSNPGCKVLGIVHAETSTGVLSLWMI